MKKLYRSKRNRMLTGVCGGIAEYFSIDPTVVRIGFAVISLVTGVGILAYLACLVLMPENPGYPG